MLKLCIVYLLTYQLVYFDWHKVGTVTGVLSPYYFLFVCHWSSCCCVVDVGSNSCVVGPPGPVRNIASTLTSLSSVNISWSPPVMGGGEFNYSVGVMCDSLVNFTKNSVTGDTRVPVPNLLPMVNCTVNITANNAAGSGPSIVMNFSSATSCESLLLCCCCCCDVVIVVYYITQSPQPTLKWRTSLM